MEFETAHLTTVHTDASGEQIQTVYVLNTIDLLEYLDNDIQEFRCIGYKFRSGKVDPKNRKPKPPPIDKSKFMISQSQRQKALETRELGMFFDNLEIE